ncbi:MAG TPA: hypothetical protein VLI06_05450 [Solimonas sp.]|nr:hypothetical protein [Solimonas sp.]
MSGHLHSRHDPLLRARLSSVTPLPGVRAGSGLLAIGPRLLALQDDAQAVVWIEPQTLQLQTQVLEGHGGALKKKDKPDYEALLLAPDGAIWLFGSGSRPNRCRIARLRPGAADAVELQEATALYALLAEALGTTPNIEGAVHLGERLRLLHRGVAAQADAWLELPAQVLAGAAPQLLALRWLELGGIDDVPLHLTDAALLPDDRMLYLAAAEYTADAVSDGPVSGAAIGVIAGERARWAALLDPDGTPSRRKVEGIAADADGRSGWLITDADDPLKAAELCRYELGGSW